MTTKENCGKKLNRNHNNDVEDGNLPSWTALKTALDATMGAWLSVGEGWRKIAQLLVSDYGHKGLPNTNSVTSYGLCSWLWKEHRTGLLVRASFRNVRACCVARNGQRY